MIDNELQAKLSTVQQQINNKLDQLLPLEIEFASQPHVDPILSAMRYSTMNAGKRLRPLLVMLFREIFPIKETTALEIATSIELFHNYTLIHDDLPAMDNDDLRRGRPSCHKQFDEATAILAGNALMSLAIELLSNLKDVNAEKKCILINRFCQMAGYNGVMFGQSLDIKRNSQQPYTVEQELFLDSKKTGELFKFTCQACYLLQTSVEKTILAQLASFAINFGIMFQLIDDLQDKEYRFAEDTMLEKIEQADQEARNLLRNFPADKTRLLYALLDYILELGSIERC